jgi:hypothetical protein
MNLHTQCEALLTLDGQKPKVSRISCRLFAHSDYSFNVRAFLVQTAGTIIEDDAITQTEVSEIIDAMCDEPFGFRELGENQYTKRIPSNDSTSSQGKENGLTRLIEIPQDIIQLVNKEIETVRLQDIQILLIGSSTADSQVIDFFDSITIYYTSVAKGIINNR